MELVLISTVIYYVSTNRHKRVSFLLQSKQKSSLLYLHMLLLIDNQLDCI